VRFYLRWAGNLLPRREQRSPASLLGLTLSDLFEALGPTFIKIGQILSARPDLLTRELTAPLARLQDGVAPFDGRLIQGIIKDAFGRPVEEIFKEFDFNPVSSASIAQVHRARLMDGRAVAVKIRRPGIARRMAKDLRLLRFFAGALARLPFMRAVPLRELVAEVGAPVQMQLDFILEAENNRRFREQFAGSERITFPRICADLCAESVLVMEYLDDLRKVTATELTLTERKTAALAGLRALYQMIFTNGFIHADMHAGNVFVRKWGEFVILDTGLVAQLTDADKRDFVDFFFGLVNNDGRDCARIIYESATYRARGHDRVAFEGAMVELIARHATLRSREFEITRFVYQLLETQRRFGIRGSTKFVMTILSMVVFDGICKQIYPDCDFQGEARGYLIMARYRQKR
jgi:ubiquinone biosynthesis protein